MRNNVTTTIDTRKLNQILRALPGNQRQAVETIAREIVTVAVVSMGEEKHGRIDDRGHQASAPGEAPALDTGFLANSLTAEVTGPASAIVYTNAEYAQELEFGGSHLAPRPFLQPAVRVVTDRVTSDPRGYFGAIVEGG